MLACGASVPAEVGMLSLSVIEPLALVKDGLRRTARGPVLHVSISSDAVRRHGVHIQGLLGPLRAIKSGRTCILP